MFGVSFVKGTANAAAAQHFQAVAHHHIAYEAAGQGYGQPDRTRSSSRYQRLSLGVACSKLR
jgi:hypothetical protein